MVMRAFAFGKWHAWDTGRTILLSNELVKRLFEFPTPDDCINWLYVNGHTEVARVLNAHYKGGV